MDSARIAVFDLDGTITRRDTYVDFLLFCLKRNPLRLLYLPALAAYLFIHKAGFKSNHWLKARYLGAIAGGLNRSQLAEYSEQFVAHTMTKNIKSQALKELCRLREEGCVLVLATASFGFYVRGIASELGFDELLCTEALFDREDRLTGKLDGKNCIGPEKASRIRELMKDRAWDTIELGYSDSKVDMPMLEMVGTPLVIDPKAATAKIAADKGFAVLRWR